MRKAVARKKLVSQIINMTMYISTVVPNIMLLTATPATSTHQCCLVQSQVLKTGLLGLLVLAAHREAQKSLPVLVKMCCVEHLAERATVSKDKKR